MADLEAAQGMRRTIGRPLDVRKHWDIKSGGQTNSRLEEQLSRQCHAEDRGNAAQSASGPESNNEVGKRIKK